MDKIIYLLFVLWFFNLCTGSDDSPKETLLTVEQQEEVKDSLLEAKEALVDVAEVIEQEVEKGRARTPDKGYRTADENASGWSLAGER
jgi:hypothetical protein